MEIQGRHVLVTGASRGIGEGIAREFARRGAQVTVSARSVAALDALATEIGGHAAAVDLFDPDETGSLIERVTAEAGPVDVLVNNAGMEYTKSFFDTSATEAARVVRLNLEVPIELTRQVLPGMRDRGSGHVLNISSMAANGALPGFAVYSATKAGLSHFTRALRQDLKGVPVRLTNLEVGPVPTDLIANMDYGPAVDGFARLRRLQLVPNVPVERVARSAVRAVERDKRAVWLPRRALLFGALTGAPQRIVEPLLRNIG